MAKVFPDGWRELAATGAAERELQTLAQLAAGLPDDYTVYHGVHWTQVEHGSYANFGEIDFAIVGPTGNRPLADHIALIVPPGGEVATHHQLADCVCRSRGDAPDFGAPGAFARIEAALDGYAPDAAGMFDELIIDEGQDFQDGWAENLLRFLRSGGARLVAGGPDAEPLQPRERATRGLGEPPL